MNFLDKRRAIKIFVIVFIILAIISYMVQPLIIAVALPSSIFAVMIRKKMFKSIAILVAILMIIIATITLTPMLKDSARSHTPQIRFVTYIAKGQYDTRTKKIELIETLGFQNITDQIYGQQQISLSYFIAAYILGDPTILNHDLKSIVFTSSFRNWLDKKGWKLEKVTSENKPNDYILWLSRASSVDLNEKWYRPIFENSINFPRSPFDDVRIEPLEGSKVLLDMPKGMVRATSPPIEKKSLGIDYERFEIPVDHEHSVTLELLSFPWRSKAFVFFCKIIFYNPLMWFIGIVSAIVIAFFTDKLKEILSGKSLRESSEKEKPVQTI